VFTVVLVIGAFCWVIADGGRAERLALLIHVTSRTTEYRHAIDTAGDVLTSAVPPGRLASLSGTKGAG
jgi:hypothetical protein